MGAGGLLLTPVDRSPYRLSFLLQDHLKKLKFMVRKSVLLNSLTFPMGLPESSTDSFHLLNVIINSKKKKKALITRESKLCYVFWFLSPHCIILSFCPHFGSYSHSPCNNEKHSFKNISNSLTFTWNCFNSNFVSVLI